MKEIITMKEILSKIKPSPAERQHFKRITAEFLQKLNSTLKKGKVNATAILGGSGAKDTWLAGNHDIDIFVHFDYQKYAARTTELSEILKPGIAKAFPGKKIIRLHGSRDYFQLQYQGSTFEVIPILNLRKAAQAKNITDVSPLHARWVNKNARKLKDEIRLAKQFFRSQSLYGAESYIGGFSGYAVEILVVYYGSFEKLLKASQAWKVKEVVDVENHYPKKDVLFQLNKSKTQSPLIVIDPVDKSRNACAALSLEKFLKLKEVAKRYLAQPLPAYFELEVITLDTLKKEAEKRKLNLVYATVQPLPGKEDVVGMKLVKVLGFVKDKLRPFAVVKSGWQWDKKRGEEQKMGGEQKGKKMGQGMSLKQQAFFYFLLEKRELPKVEVRAGPPLTLKEHVEGFKKHYRHNGETFVENGRVMVRVGVKDYRLADFVKGMVKNEYVRERVGKVVGVVIG